MERRETDRLKVGSSWVKRIVVAADGSPASRQGLEQVGNLAPGSGAAVTVVFVRHLPAAALMASGLVGQLVLGSGVRGEVVVCDGMPGEEVLKVVEEAGADLVVIGSNRHSSLHNLLLGSTAAHLTAHSPVPVLVMRSKGASDAKPVPVEASGRRR